MVSSHHLLDILENEQTLQHPQPRTTNWHRRQTSKKSQFPLAWKWWWRMTNNRKHYSNQSQKNFTCSFLSVIPTGSCASRPFAAPLTPITLPWGRLPGGVCGNGVDWTKEEAEPQPLSAMRIFPNPDPHLVFTNAQQSMSQETRCWESVSYFFWGGIIRA